MGVLASGLSLGGVRLYGLYLEHRLADCMKKIESVGDRYAILEERHASLMSPSRIYNYAKSELHMVAASEIEVIKLISESYKGAETANAPGGTGAAGPGKLASLIVGTANAGD
jgi:hypothetical protein